METETPTLELDAAVDLAVRLVDAALLQLVDEADHQEVCRRVAAELQRMRPIKRKSGR